MTSIEGYEVESTVFLTVEDVSRIHDELLLIGQLTGVKREDGLRSAVGRAEVAAIYDHYADISRIAAYYWHGITVSHAFHDGNKRAGFVSMLVFLELNGWEFVGPDAVMGPVIYGLFEADRFTLEVLDHIVSHNLRPLSIDMV